MFVSSPRWKLRVFGLTLPVYFSIEVFNSVHVTSSLTAMKAAMKILRGLLNISHFLLVFAISSSTLIFCPPST